MAAVAVKGITGAQLLALLPLDSELVQWASEAGAKVSVFATGVQLGFKGHSIMVPVKLETLAQLQHGKLSLLGKKSLALSVANALKQLQKHAAPPPHWPAEQLELATPAEKAAYPIGGALDLLKGNKPSDTAAEPTEIPKPVPEQPNGTQVAAASAWPIFDLGKLKTAPTIKLRDATMMYQPVTGTNSGTRYFMVAASHTLRIAARYKGDSLSIRIEGPGWEHHIKDMQACGFTNVNQAKGYASMHLNVPDEVLASKALGAVLLGLGVPLQTPIPDLKLLKDQGS